MRVFLGMEVGFKLPFDRSQKGDHINIIRKLKHSKQWEHQVQGIRNNIGDACTPCTAQGNSFQHREI